MAKVHKYDMSRRLDNGKWEVVGKAYKDSESGRLTVWVDPAKMAKIIKGQKDDVPFILFDKDPEPLPVCPQTTAPAVYIDPATTISLYSENPFLGENDDHLCKNYLRLQVCR